MTNEQFNKTVQDLKESNEMVLQMIETIENKK